MLAQRIIKDAWAFLAAAFLILAVIEIFSLDLYFIMLGVGALTGAAADFAGAPAWLQVVLFDMASIGMLFLCPADRHASPAQVAGRRAHLR
ncbi:hypothetical protein [Glutamicibacter sp. V16R2B1]|uniref:NfeD family protein n=1 Tax=unclassified Glutamicibacter TaxID=2627139 RepID=UPI0010FE579E|nr:hypothetical protein [Glutamicibacter sp. V16R2B1]TLK54341.1 hypothetical protein FDN03_05460 [Glutamicibacter sp. V16R2B1]